MAKRGRLAYQRLSKLKELLRYMLKMNLNSCFFCEEPLDTGLTSDLFNITVHHINGDHEDNRPENLGLSHTPCHKHYHAMEILHGEA